MVAPSDTTPPLLISAALSVDSSPTSDFSAPPFISSAQQAPKLKGEDIHIIKDAEFTHWPFAIQFPRSNSPPSHHHRRNSSRFPQSLSSTSLSQAPSTRFSHSSHTPDSMHASEQHARAFPRYRPYPPQAGLTPLELRFFARTTGPSAYLGMSLEDVEAGRDLLNGALVKLSLDILQKAYEAKQADQDYIVHQVAQTAAAIESLEWHRVLLAMVKQHQEVELTMAESVMGIVKNFLSPHTLADLEDDRGYYRAVFADELVRLTVAKAQMQQISAEFHPTSGFLYPGRGKTLLDHLKEFKFEHCQERSMFYPFQDEGEWDLAKFLTLNLTKSQVSQFLKLKWFENCPKPSFNTVEKLFGWLATLPQGSAWWSLPITFKGFKMTRPIRFLHHNSLDIVRELVSNPMFARYMTYDPHVVMKGADHEYSEFLTSTCASEIQNQLPAGATMIPIILASDKTPVMHQMGGLEMHPVFITIGNIQSDMRMQATSHAWHCITFILTPEFEVHHDYKTILLARLFRHRLDEVVAPLKHAALHGAELTDAMGGICFCYAPLVSYIVDLPEQQLIAGVAMSASSVTLAERSELGRVEAAESWMGKQMLIQIFKLCQRVDPWDLDAFQKAAKLLKLLSIHKPFWRNWKFTEPSLFLTGEILHTLHKFFFNHVLTWCKELVGAHTLDTHFKLLH